MVKSATGKMKKDHGKTSSMIFVMGSSIKGTADEKKMGGSFRFKEGDLNEVNAISNPGMTGGDMDNNNDDPLNGIILVPITKINSRSKNSNSVNRT